jgi:SAM-dependent methyltransferase
MVAGTRFLLGGRVGAVLAHRARRVLHLRFLCQDDLSPTLIGGRSGRHGGGAIGAMTFDPKAVRMFEHAGWQQAAGAYRVTFARASGEFVDALLDAAGVGDSQCVLDLACGPGIIAAAVQRRGASVSGLDFSQAMLAVARAANPDIHFHEADAEAMPIADGSLDVVVSNFGAHQFPRPERALAEVFRVLRPGGVVAVTSWADPAKNIAWRLLFDAIRTHGDPNAAKTPPSGGGLSDRAAVSRLLTDSGFVEASAEIVRREWRLARPADLISSLRRGTVRTAALIDAQPPNSVPAIEAEIARCAEPYRRGDAYFIPIAAILGRGVRPG